MKKIKTLEISAKRWFQKSYGNTYHVVKAVVNGKDVVVSGVTYGYGNHFLTTIADLLRDRGYTVPEDNSKAFCHDDEIPIHRGRCKKKERLSFLARGVGMYNKYLRNIKWAVFTIIDRATQDDRKSKVKVSGAFSCPSNAEEFIKTLPTGHKWYVLDFDRLERFEEFYNYVQNINEQYGDYAIFHINDGGFLVDELNWFSLCP